MAKKVSGGGRKPGRPKRGYSVVIDAELGVRIGEIALALGMTRPAWLNNRLGPIVDEEWRRVVGSKRP